MKKKTPRIVIIAVLSLITVLVWFGSEVFRNLSKKPETKVPEELLAPLDPTLDEESLNKLENSLFFDPSQIQAPPTLAPSEAPVEAPTDAPSPTTEPSTSPIFTPAPTL